jgi:hypothetical protein
MKAHLRIPTKTPYAYIEVDTEGNAQEIVAAYNEVNEAYWGQNEGLPAKEWNEALDSYLAGKGISPDQHEKMSEKQKWMIHEIDKSKKRT